MSKEGNAIINHRHTQSATPFQRLKSGQVSPLRPHISEAYAKIREDMELRQLNRKEEIRLRAEKREKKLLKDQRMKK